MENASKALMMAGGILIALLVIGALLLMFNQLGSYSRSQDDNVKTSQLADFNLDFERYCDDKGIKGADIISLINKISDYNHKANTGGVNNSVDYSIKMSIKIRGFDKFNEKYISTLFENRPYNGEELRGIVTAKYYDDETKRTISEFKSSTFKCYTGPEYENGQIKDLFFEFVDD